MKSLVKENTTAQAFLNIRDINLHEDCDATFDTVCGWMDEFVSLKTKHLQKENDKLNALTTRLNKALNNGRHYLMGVPRNDVTVDDALDAFGFGRNGLENP